MSVRTSNTYTEGECKGGSSGGPVQLNDLVLPPSKGAAPVYFKFMGKVHSHIGKRKDCPCNVPEIGLSPLKNR
eukprot:1159496-Pelagomonas_calceolata.AAC.10